MQSRDSRIVILSDVIFNSHQTTIVDSFCCLVCILLFKLMHALLNPYKPGVQFLGHSQTVQTQIRRGRTRRSDQILHCLLTGISIKNMLKIKTKVHQAPLT